MKYFSDYFNTAYFNLANTRPLDYNPSLLFQCKTDAELRTENPVFEPGCIVAVRTSTGSVFGYKIGDGKTPYNSLSYVDLNFSAQTPKKIDYPTDTPEIIDGGTSHV